MDAEERFLGYMVLGSVKDGAAFENIIKEVEVPKLKESSQDWVRKVVEEAVKAELLPESALSQLAKVPTHPQTEGT
jgi:formiminotetrahydrofolate cyclodeaminase